MARCPHTIWGSIPGPPRCLKLHAPWNYRGDTQLLRQGGEERSLRNFERRPSSHTTPSLHCTAPLSHIRNPRNMPPAVVLKFQGYLQEPSSARRVWGRREVREWGLSLRAPSRFGPHSWFWKASYATSRLDHQALALQARGNVFGQ